MDTSKNIDINIIKYKGFDSIYEKVEIPYYDALLGCEYILEKPDHKKIKVFARMRKNFQKLISFF